eukprot:GHUV01058595.1.p1 GENE.GHUV01058595.1~~GHUV01058595.1.p1  ORF type:complete len:140 (-),score=27.47 GHUV01058595.1:47-466(-)
MAPEVNIWQAPGGCCITLKAWGGVHNICMLLCNSTGDLTAWHRSASHSQLPDCAVHCMMQVLKCPYKSKPEENKEKVHLHYSNTVDSWAVGVLVYELLVGCPPFSGKNKEATEARIVSGVPRFPPTMSEAAKNFILAGR